MIITPGELGKEIHVTVLEWKQDALNPLRPALAWDTKNSAESIFSQRYGRSIKYYPYCRIRRYVPASKRKR